MSSVPLAFNPASMQSLGSAITYARRYALAALVGVVTEADDDGYNAAEDQARPASRNRHAETWSSRERRTRLAALGTIRGSEDRKAFVLFDTVDLVSQVQAMGRELGAPEKPTGCEPSVVSAVVERLSGDQCRN